jgi:hypothetical protein
MLVRGSFRKRKALLATADFNFAMEIATHKALKAIEAFWQKCSDAVFSTSQPEGYRHGNLGR